MINFTFYTIIKPTTARFFIKESLENEISDCRTKVDHGSQMGIQSPKLLAEIGLNSTRKRF